MPSAAIPTHDQMWSDILEILACTEEPMRAVDFVEPLAERYGLDEALVSEMYESGNGPVFADRIQWALSYLNLSGFMSKPKRGQFLLEDENRKWADAALTDLQAEVTERLRRRDIEKARAQSESPSEAKVSSPVVAVGGKSANPQEELYASFNRLRDLVYDDILRTLREKSPEAFERIVVKLLQRMGYGGEVKNSGSVTQYGHDGGIDGIIKEDVLGFGRIYIQAKRYAEGNTVGRPEIQGFIGALAGVGASKGVFITTSSFSRGAQEYASTLSTGTSLILIYGQQLAAYVYDYGFGMKSEEPLEIKRLDTDWWDAYGVASPEQRTDG